MPPRLPRPLRPGRGPRQRSRRQSDPHTLNRRLGTWADLLLIDELGYLTFDARGADLLYQVINRRYQRSSTVITTNLAFKDWGKLFHNTAAASAIADRLVHRGKSKRSDEEVE